MRFISEKRKVCLRWDSKEAHYCHSSLSRIISILNAVSLKRIPIVSLKTDVIKEAINQAKNIHVTKENSGNWNL